MAPLIPREGNNLTINLTILYENDHYIAKITELDPPTPPSTGIPRDPFLILGILMIAVAILGIPMYRLIKLKTGARGGQKEESNNARDEEIKQRADNWPSQGSHFSGNSHKPETCQGRW